MDAAHSHGPLALVGSGEYLAHMADIEGALIAQRPPRYVQLATASVPDGEHVVAKWHRLGAEQAERLDVEQVIVPVASRADANDPEVAALVEGAGLIYLSGGHPAFLADTLRDTLVWETIDRVWRAGAALAGCSAGAMVMGAWVPNVRGSGGATGLGVLPHVRVLPHYDAYFARVANARARFRGDDATVTLVGIDEDTALIHDGGEWRVAGHSKVWLLGEQDQSFTAGDKVPLQ